MNLLITDTIVATCDDERRTLERGLDRLPTAMEKALQDEQAPPQADGPDGDAYGSGIVEG